MSHKSSFFNAVESEGVYDRTYNAADFAEFFAQFIGNGVYANPSSGLQVRASSGMQITINPGYAWINGYMFSVLANTTDTLTLTTADALYNRIDSVVVGLNLTNREITPYVRSGSPSANPAPVSLVRTSTVYEIELAQIQVPAGSYAITQADITDMRPNTTRCGWVAGLIDQIDSTDLFLQFTSQFNAWLSTYQDVLDEDTAANLLSRILSLEQDRSRFYTGSYTGNGQLTKSITLPFAPKRLEVLNASKTWNSSGGYYNYFVQQITIWYSEGSYKGVYVSNQYGSVANSRTHVLTVAKSSTPQGETIISWEGTERSATYVMDVLNQKYCVQAWG